MKVILGTFILRETPIFNSGKKKSYVVFTNFDLILYWNLLLQSKNKTVLSDHTGKKLMSKNLLL